MQVRITEGIARKDFKSLKFPEKFTSPSHYFLFLQEAFKARTSKDLNTFLKANKHLQRKLQASHDNSSFKVRFALTASTFFKTKSSFEMTVEEIKNIDKIFEGVPNERFEAIQRFAKYPEYHIKNELATLLLIFEKLEKEGHRNCWV